MSENLVLLTAAVVNVLIPPTTGDNLLLLFKNETKKYKFCVNYSCLLIQLINLGHFFLGVSSKRK